MYISTALLEFAIIVIFVIVFYYNDKKKRQIDAEKREFEDEIKSLKKQIEALERKLSDLEERERERFVLVIENEIYRVQSEGHYTKYTEDELCSMILEYGEKIGVTTIEDISFFLFEDTIKAALYASKGYFDIHTSPSGARYRIGKKGKHIPVTDEEIEMLKNYDFDFIFDSLA